MMAGQGGSVTHWLGDLRGGDLAAAQPIWERYFGRLVVLARGNCSASGFLGQRPTRRMPP